MADIYLNLTYDEYKGLEGQCRAFDETAHGTGTEYYHKAFVLRIGELRLEFHGPNVKARQPAEESVIPHRQCSNASEPHLQHEWTDSEGQHRWCVGTGMRQ